MKIISLKLMSKIFSKKKAHRCHFLLLNKHLFITPNKLLGYNQFPYLFLGQVYKERLYHRTNYWYDYLMELTNFLYALKSITLNLVDLRFEHLFKESLWHRMDSISHKYRLEQNRFDLEFIFFWKLNFCVQI